MTMLTAPYLQTITQRPSSGPKNAYPLCIPLFREEALVVKFTTPVTIISGENGTGKSTLLEAIADNCGFNLSGGNANHLTQQSNDIIPLREVLTFSWSIKVREGFFLRAETLFNFASYLEKMAKDFGDIAYDPYGGKSLHQQSHGEAFLNVLQNRLNGRGIFILDEPEAALSPQRQFQLLSILHEAHKSGKSQIIMATHSPILLSYPFGRILEIDAEKIVEKAYRTTRNFGLYARFLADPHRFHQELFQE